MSIKKTLLSLSLLALCANGSEDSLLKPVNDLGYGTWNARLQTLSMARNFENGTPVYAYSTTAGLQLGYVSPELAGFSGGLTWLYVEPMDASADSHNGRTLISNGRVNVLNEAWLKYRCESLGLSKTFVQAGRQVITGEVFRVDEFRQKPRAVEAVQLTSKDRPDLAVTAGHAWRLSSWLDNDAAWEFNNFGNVFGANYNTRGITWAEGVYTGIQHLEMAAYMAYAYDLANMVGGRIKYTLTDSTALTGYGRHETDVGQGTDHRAAMYGISVQQQVGVVTLEPGFLAISDDGLLFQETTTGINHPLGASMMIYAGMFDGGADNYYFKATTKIGPTALYALYDYATQRTTPFTGQELDLMIAQTFTAHLNVALKFGAGYRDRKDQKDDTFATDTRLFVTYNF